MRRKRISAAVASVLVVGSVAVASAATTHDSRTSDSDDRKMLVLDLVAHVADDNVIDVGPRDSDPNVFVEDDEGDGFVLDIDLSHKGKPIGKESTICIYTAIEKDGARTLHCTAVQTLPGGELTTEGAIHYGPNEPIRKDPYSTAIKGGTGKYRTAHGDTRIQELTPYDWRLTLRIIP
jgi:hypothetical protein